MHYPIPNRVWLQRRPGKENAVTFCYPRSAKYEQIQRKMPHHLPGKGRLQQDSISTALTLLRIHEIKTWRRRIKTSFTTSPKGQGGHTVIDETWDAKGDRFLKILEKYDTALESCQYIQKIHQMQEYLDVWVFLCSTDHKSL